MAPSGSRTRAKTKPTRKPRRTPFKKKHVQPKNTISQEMTSPNSPSNSSSSVVSNDLPKIEGIDFDALDDVCPSACSTPKAQRFRIPEIVTCPPAPKKKRVNISSNCLFGRSPIAFFAPPDLELFFYFENGGISV